MTDAEKELRLVLAMLVQKVQRERDARVLLVAAQGEFIAARDLDRTTRAEVLATFRAAEKRLNHDEYITDCAVREAVSLLDTQSQPLERVASCQPT